MTTTNDTGNPKPKPNDAESLIVAVLKEAGGRQTEQPEVRIAIDQSEPFFGNGKISGTVEIVVKTEKMTRGVVVHCYGDAKVMFEKPSCHWQWQHHRFRTNKVNLIQQFTSTEIFADSWQYVLGGPKVKQYKLSPGTQRLPFAFRLPKTVAASYSGKYGRVEYKIMVKIKGYGEKVRDQVTMAVFRVDSPLNLNNFQDSWKSLAVAAKERKRILGLVCGIIGFVFETPHQGLIIGDTVEFNGELVNTTSDWIVERVEIRIFQSHLFAADGEMAWYKSCIWEDEHGGIDPGKITFWSGTIGPIPDVLPSTLGGCHIIRLSYWLQVCMKYRKPCCKKQFQLTEASELLIGNNSFDEALMEKYHTENERERQHDALRVGIRYRPSVDEILGHEPSISYFAKFGDHVQRKSDDDEMSKMSPSDHTLFSSL